jgi:hypothetical protein
MAAPGQSRAGSRGRTRCQQGQPGPGRDARGGGGMDAKEKHSRPEPRSGQGRQTSRPWTAGKPQPRVSAARRRGRMPQKRGRPGF